MILFELRAAILAALADHGLDQPKTYFARVVRTVGNRLSVQKIDKKDGADDANPIEVWPGVPGVSSDPASGEVIAVSLVGQAQTPVVTHRSPPLQPGVSEFGPVPTGPLPLEVRHDAVNSIRMLSRSLPTAKMYVGDAPTVPVALAPDLVAYLQALELWSVQIDLVLTAAGLDVLVPTYAATKTARTTAAGNIANIPAIRLEAK